MEEIPNLFAIHPTEVSTLNVERNVSKYRGSCFKAEYKNTFKINSNRTFYGRIIDLQPVLNGGKIEGVRLLYKRGRFAGGKWTEDHKVHDDPFGPFSDLARYVAEVKMKGPNDDEPVVRSYPQWALSNDSPTDNNMRLTLTLFLGL